MNLRVALELHGPSLARGLQYVNRTDCSWCRQTEEFMGEFAGQEPDYVKHVTKTVRASILGTETKTVVNTYHYHGLSKTPYCHTCVDPHSDGFDGGFAEWPCATWRALTEES